MDSADINNLLYAVVAAGIGFALVWLLLDRRTDRKSRHNTAEENSTPWWQVLELAPDASRDQTRTAYWKKMQEFQPNRISQLGPQLRPLAELRAKELKAAFEQSEKRFTTVTNARPTVT